MQIPSEDEFRAIAAVMTRNDFKELLALMKCIPGIAEFTRMREGLKSERGVSFPLYDEQPIVDEFRQEAYRLGIVVNFDWPAWNEGKVLLADRTSDFTRLDLETLCKLVTVIIRNDRFCEGFLASQFEDGTVGRILAGIEAWFEQKKV